MVKPINIGVDLDGVVASFNRAFSKIANFIYGDRFPILSDDVSSLSWDWTKWYNDITSEEIESVWDYVRMKENFWTTLDTINPNSIEYFIQFIYNVSYHNIYFITARESTKGLTAEKQSTLWLSNIGFKYPQVIGAYDKGPIVKCLDIKHFIDDKTENILDVVKYSPETHVYIHDAKHNNDGRLDHLNENPKFHRVKNLFEFSNYIMDIEMESKILEKSKELHNISNEIEILDFK